MKQINKLFLSTLGLGLLVGYSAHAQLGVNIGAATPQTSLDVSGAITTRPVSVAVASNAATVPANAGLVVLTGSATADIVLTSAATPFAGQLLTLVNNTTGGQRALLNGIPINNGQALLFVGDAASSNFKSADNGAAAGAATTYWNLRGNAGTSPATNFLGTTDAQDQAFRTNNTERMRILSGGNVGLGTTAPKSTLEVNGSLAANYTSITAASYTLTSTDFYVVYRGTTAATLTLPSGVGVKGRLYTIKNTTAAQTLTVNAASGEGIDGNSSFTVPPGQGVQLVTTGATAAGTVTFEIASFAAATSAGAGDNLGNHTATQNLNLQSNALVGTGADLGSTVGVGVRTDGGLNLGQNSPGNNVFLGFQSGQANTTGTQNVFNGYQSGQANTTGIQNVFSGTYSGYANTTGGYNVFNGYQSGYTNSTGNNNVFTGLQSGQNNTTGSSNVFTGLQSGQNNTTGNNNVFSGAYSGQANTTGNNNTFDGFQSGRTNTTGIQNVFSGTYSGYANTTGNNNVFNGYQSGYTNSTGNNNVFTGLQSGQNNTTGSSNVFNGYQSGQNNTTGNSNVFNGYQSGIANTTGSSNLALGYSAGPSTGALTNATAIGANASVSANNSLVLGSINGTNGATASTSVGIGTTAPKSTLEVNGSFGANYLSVTTATYTLLATDFYVTFKGTAAGTLTLPSGLNTKGRLYTVKNGTAAQTLTLNTTNSETIDGSTSVSIPAGQSVQVVTSGATSGAATYEIVDFSSASSAGSAAGVTASNGLTATNGNVKLGGTLTGNTEIATGTAVGSNNLTITGNGYFGLGIYPGTTPSSKFQIITDASTGGGEDDYLFDDYGSSAASLSNHILLRTSRGTIASPTPSVNGDPLGGITFAPRIGTGTGSLTYSGSEIYGYYKGDGTSTLTDLRFLTSSAEKMRLDETGRLGLGTTTPQSTLEVNGSVAGNYRSITATGTTVLTATDFVVVYSGTAAGTFTLPSGLNAKGRQVTIKNGTAAQTLTLNTTSSETISGNTSVSIPAGQSVMVVTTGATSGAATYEIVDFSSASSAGSAAGVTASNGLTATSGNVKLGGTLTAATDVATGGFGLTFSGAGKFGFGTTTLTGLFNVSGAMGTTSTGGLNFVNTTGIPISTASGASTVTTLSVTPGYAGANTGITTGIVATYDLPGTGGNHVFGENVIPDGSSPALGSTANRWSTVYGVAGNFSGGVSGTSGTFSGNISGVSGTFSGAMTYGQSSPTASVTAGATDYFVVPQSALTYTLPNSAANKGRTIVIFSYGGATTVATTTGGIFDPTNFSSTATTSYSLAQFHRITFFCDGSNWIATAYL